jgi:hypothetical protein
LRGRWSDELIHQEEHDDGRRSDHSRKAAQAHLFKGTRTLVAVVFENLEEGMTIDEVMAQFPVSPEQVKAVLEFASTLQCLVVDAYGR